MRAGECVRVAAPLEARVAFLIDEYRHFLADPAALMAQLDCLGGLYGKPTIAGWQVLAERGEWEALVADLLANHYDPAYRRSTDRNYPRLPEAHILEPRELTAASISRMAKELHAIARREHAVA
jgi:tRNA 2-selenouridine synthase